METVKFICEFFFTNFWHFLGLIILIGCIPTIKFTRHKTIDARDYWYNHPHYHVLDNGDKINIPDYIEWEDWKDKDRSTKHRMLVQIEHRLLHPNLIKSDNGQY